MYQKDYILRMVEMLGEFIAAILSLIKKGNFKQAAQMLNHVYYYMLRKDASFFQNIPIDELTGTLIKEHNYTNGHLEILAELFYAEAELQYAQGKHDGSLIYYMKSLKIFEFIEKEYKSFSVDRQTKMAYVKGQISEINQKL
jgi:hypothetical protein